MGDADRQVFEWLNGLAGRWDAFDNTFKLLVSDFFLPVIITLATFMLWFAGRTLEERTRHQRAFLYAVSGAGWANLIVRVINHSYVRERPFATLDDVHVLFYQPTDPSFPSNAASFAFAMAAGVFLVNRRWGLLIGVGAVLFSLARVIAGMHYPLDVVAGAALGIATTWAFARVLDVLRPVVDWALRLVRWFYAG